MLVGNGGAPIMRVGAQAYLGADGTVNHNIPVPAGAQSGDTLVVFLATNVTSSGQMSTPSGWTRMFIAPSANSTFSVRIYAYTRTISGTPPAFYTFTVAVSGAGYEGGVVCYRRMDGGTMRVAGAPFATSAQSGSTMTSPNVGALSSGVILRMFSSYDGAGLETDPHGLLSDYTPLVRNVRSSSGSRNTSIFEAAIPAGLSVGTRTMSLPGSRLWNAATIILDRG